MDEGIYALIEMALVFGAVMVFGVSQLRALRKYDRPGEQSGRKLDGDGG